MWESQKDLMHLKLCETENKILVFSKFSELKEDFTWKGDMKLNRIRNFTLLLLT